jgi:long-subunit acyl-CoA synthetase (AMP-forming)
MFISRTSPLWRMNLLRSSYRMLSSSFVTIPLFQQPSKLNLSSEKIAIRTEKHPEGYSYSQLLYDSDQFASKLENLLKSQNISPSDSPRIAFWVQPGYEYVVVQNAIWRCGGVSVPLCVTHPLAELEYFVTDAQCAVVVGPHNSGLDLEGLANKCGAKFLAIDQVSPLEKGSPVEADVESRFRKVQSVTDNIGEKPALIIYTSGTTGKVNLFIAIIQSHVLFSLKEWLPAIDHFNPKLLLLLKLGSGTKRITFSMHCLFTTFMVQLM